MTTDIFDGLGFVDMTKSHLAIAVGAKLDVAWGGGFHELSIYIIEEYSYERKIFNITKK